MSTITKKKEEVEVVVEEENVWIRRMRRSEIEWRRRWMESETWWSRRLLRLERELQEASDRKWNVLLNAVMKAREEEMNDIRDNAKKIREEHVERYPTKETKEIEGSIVRRQRSRKRNEVRRKDVDKTHDYMFKLLGEAGCASIDAIYYSETNLRNDIFAKPNTGMFKKCEEENPYIKFKKGFFVGDKISDLKAAHRIGAKPILVRTGHGEETIKELNKFSNRDLKKRVSIFNDLKEFANWLDR